MKKTLMTGIILLFAAMAVLFIAGCPDTTDPNTGDDDATLIRLRITSPGYTGTTGRADASLGKAGKTVESAEVGTISLKSPEEDDDGPTLVIKNPVVSASSKITSAKKEYAKSTTQSPGTFGAFPKSLKDNDYLFVKVTSGKAVLYYVVKVSVDFVAAGGGGGRLTNIDGEEIKFDINAADLPAPSWWDTQSGPDGFYEYPNIFVRANGEQITDPLDWEAYRDENNVRRARPLNNKIPAGWTLEPGGRRAEVLKILQYYHHGFLQPAKSVEIVTNPGAGSGAATIRVTGVNDVSANLSFTITIPANAPNGRPVSADNPAPLFFSVGVTLTDLQANGWATVSAPGGSDSSNGIYNTIYGISDTDPNRPSNVLMMAWACGRIMDACEQGLYNGRVDYTKTATSGVSRNGKAAMMIGAFAESMSGSRLTISVPASSGANGANVERWSHQKPGNGRPAKGYNQFRLRYITGLGIGTDASGTGQNSNITYGIAPREWVIDGNNAFNLQGRRTQIQQWKHARQEQAGWFGPRIQDFEEKRLDFSLTTASGNGQSGLLSGTPYDQHFTASLSAPNVWMGSDGWQANTLNSGDGGWVSQEPVYMNFLLTRELYDFLGVSDHCTVVLTNSGHAWPDVQIRMFIDYANWFFNKNHGTDYSRQQGTQGLAVKTTDEHPVLFTDDLTDDQGNPVVYSDWYNPLKLEDYLRVTWKNPNRTKQWNHEYPPGAPGKSIADNVRAYFADHRSEMVDLNGDPITLDYENVLLP